MQNVTVTRDTWAERAEAAGLRLEEIAVLTGKSYSAVYRYKTGSRVAPAPWLVEVGVLIRSRELARSKEGAA